VPVKRILQILGVTLLAVLVTWSLPLVFYLIPLVYGAFLIFFVWMFKVITPEDFKTWKRALRKP